MGSFVQSKKSSDYLSNNISSPCDVELLQLAVEGEPGSFDLIPALLSQVMEGDVMEEDEDNEDGVHFASLESQFEKRVTVSNW